MAEVCERHGAAGLPLWRVGVFVRTLHPDIFGRNFVWRPGAEVELGTVDFDILIRRIFTPARCRSCSSRGWRFGPAWTIPQSTRFPFLDDMRAEGVTDYIALPLPFTDGIDQRVELDHEAAGRLHRRTVGGAAERSCRRWRGSSRSSACAAPPRACSTPMSATAPASGSSADRSAAAIPRPCMPRSGCRICAASPRCRTGCRPRPWSIFSTSISIARWPRSGRMAARC